MAFAQRLAVIYYRSHTVRLLSGRLLKFRTSIKNCCVGRLSGDCSYFISVSIAGRGHSERLSSAQTRPTDPKGAPSFLTLWRARSLICHRQPLSKYIWQVLMHSNRCHVLVRIVQSIAININTLCLPCIEWNASFDDAPRSGRHGFHMFLIIDSGSVSSVTHSCTCRQNYPIDPWRFGCSAERKRVLMFPC